MEAARLGLSIYPPTEDGEKKPDGPWKENQSIRASLDQIQRWYGTTGPPRRTGLGIVCGTVSGNIEAFEFDALGRLYGPFLEAARALGLGELVERISAGYEEESPSGGVHWLYRCSTIAGNTPLARYLSDDLNEKGEPIPKPLIETRGQGGYLVIAPSNGRVHPTGKPYVLRRGGLDTIAEITPEERESLWALARSFDELAEAEQPSQAEVKARKSSASGWTDIVETIDDFNARASWEDILETKGGTLSHTRGKTQYWTRPGKDVREGHSATVNHLGTDRLKCFSTSWGIPTKGTHDKFSVYAYLNHNGDFSATVKALSQAGYGQHKVWVEKDGKYVLETRQNPYVKARGTQFAKPGEGPPMLLHWPSSANSNGHAAEPDEDDYENATLEQLGVRDQTVYKFENTEFLWPRRFVKNKLNLIAGEGGDGKTTVAAMVGATVMMGGKFPDGTPAGAPGLVLMMSAEDGVGDTLRPRFVAAGADPLSDRLKFLEPRVVIPKTDKRPALVHPVNLQNVPYWRALFRRLRPVLFIIDPLPAFMGRGINDHRNADVQQVLDAFAKVALEFGVCVIAITHLGKSVQPKVIHKVLGSVAYTNVARVVHVTVRDPDDPMIRYLERPKCNCDTPVDALAYKLVPHEFTWDGVAYKTTRAEFEAEPVAIDLEAMANPKSDQPRRGPDPKKEIKVAEFLHDFLNGRPGWTERSAVYTAAGDAGLIGVQDPVTQRWSNGTLVYRAKKRIPALEEPRHGKRIEEQDMATDRDRYPRICWRLVDADAAF
jgi:hypothetical protein